MSILSLNYSNFFCFQPISIIFGFSESLYYPLSFFLVSECYNCTTNDTSSNTINIIIIADEYFVIKLL